MEAEDFQDELTCSICLDYFQDPVSIECGHNFCRHCLNRSWTPSVGYLLCPECRQQSTPRAMRPNWALARITDKRRRAGRQGAGSQELCRRHQEPLRLFCEVDQRPVCLVCRESQEHQAHAMAPIDEAFEDYRKKLVSAECRLEVKMKMAMQLQDTELKNATKWKEKIKNQEMRISTEFSKLHHFLADEEQLILQRLREEDEETQKKMNENMLMLNQIITSLKKLILEVGAKSQASTLELLQNPKDVLTRCENQDDVNYSPEVLNVKTVCQIPMMKEMLKRFRVAVSLAEATAHPKLIISQEGRYVKNGAPASYWPVFSTAWSYFTGRKIPQYNIHVERFQHLPCVLGKNVFTSGKHYWEVENKDSLEIAVGVCREDVMGINDSRELSPHMGIWIIYWSSAGYRPLTSLPVIPVKQEPALHRVGIYLDHGAGNVSFYSAVDGAHLHTFSFPFVSRLRPFFWLSPLASLVIPVADGK